MIIKNKTCYVFDIETLPNCFICTILNTESLETFVFEISERKCEHRELIRFLADREKSGIFTGYNIKHYDTVIINYILMELNTNKYSSSTMCQSINRLSDTIITDKKKENKHLYSKYKYARFLDTIDLATMTFPRKLMASLKSLEITMHYRNVQEMVIDWNANIPLSRIDELIEYNKNDVFATFELLKRSEKKVRLRENIEKEYGIECLSLDDVTTGVSILEKRYIEEASEKPQALPYTNLISMKDVVFDKIKFTTPVMKELLNELLNYVHDPTSKGKKAFEKEFVYNGLKYSFGIGGLHSINQPEIIIPKKEYTLRDIDAESLYPNMILKNDCAPRHLGEAFLRTYKRILDERLTAKHSGNETTNIALKFALNGVSGNMDRHGSWLYDPLQVLRIRINGQLLFLMLTEKLTGIGCKVVSANTDGLSVLVPDNIEVEWNKVCQEWETFSSLTLEEVCYEKLIIQTVNSYIAVKKGFTENIHNMTRKDLLKKYVKTKNKFLVNVELGKGLTTPRIVPKALINYFLFNEPIEKTIEEEEDFKLFIMSQKTDSKFKVRFGLNKNIQLYNRFYVSNSGEYLVKYTDNPDDFEKIITQPVQLINNFDNIKSIEEMDIYYPYYLNECRKLIYVIEPRQLTLF